MSKKSSNRFSCPRCERKDFRSLIAVKTHFIEEGHAFQCPVCKINFKDELAIIQHYQKYDKSVSSSIPSDSRRILSPSVPSKNAVATPVVQSKAVQTDTPERASKLSKQGPEIQHGHLSHNLLAYMPVLNLEGGLITEGLPNSTSGIALYPAYIHPLEQNLILRYLRSRCHSWDRLQTEGYILGPACLRNKKRPCKGSIQTYHFRDTPRRELQDPGNISAIAIDCEMVGVKNGRQALAFLSAINFLTGEVLISRYVTPTEEVLDWRSEFSGVTQAIMTSAVASGAAFRNWREARDKLWDFMDDSTVLVGHSLHYDLEVLGISHAKVVDSAILTAETVFPSIPSTKPLTRMWGLKRLAKDLLGLDIQTGSCGHSALEDAHAARDVTIWCIRNPEELKLWAEKARLQEEQRLAPNRKKYGKRKGKLPATQYTRSSQHNTEHYDDYESFQWSELAEELGWPEGYDPWSD